MKYGFVRYWFRFASRPYLDRDIPSKYLFISKMFSRRLQDMSSKRLSDVFSVTILVFQDVLKTSCEMSSKRSQDVFKTYLRDVMKTSSRRLGRRKNVAPKTCLEDVFKTSWRPTMLAGLFIFSVLLSGKLQALPCNFSKSNTHSWVFFTFSKLH